MKKLKYFALVCVLTLSGCVTAPPTGSSNQADLDSTVIEDTSNQNLTTEGGGEEQTSIGGDVNTVENNTTPTNDGDNINFNLAYYSSVNPSLRGAAMKTEISSVISKNHNQQSYDALWTAFKTTDVHPGTNKIWDMYSDGASYSYTAGSKQCGNYSGEGSCYNREHSFPKSWFNDKSPMYTDLFHLYPTDGQVNGWRSNYGFGEVASASRVTQNGSKLGSSKYSGMGSTVFEPLDKYKGDFARTYFYMATRYESVLTTWSSPHFNKTKYPTFNPTSLDMFIKWHENDPVSKKEIDRNEAVYKIQKNRNPFIDYPSLVHQIWEQ